MCRFSSTVCNNYCSKNGECRLQIAVKYVGLEKVRYSISCRSVPLISEPFFDHDHNLCILCERCVRICRDIRGEGVLQINLDYHCMHWIGPGVLGEIGVQAPRRYLPDGRSLYQVRSLAEV